MALLASELSTLLGAMLAPTPAESEEAGGSTTAAGQAAVPRLQLALPGVTLPFSHAAPLWLALAVALTVHEVRRDRQLWGVSG